MDENDKELLEAFEAFNKNFKSNSFVGIVKTVNEDEYTIEVEYDEQLYSDVRLKSVINQSDKEFVVIPSVGSAVFCIPEEDSKEKFIVSKYSEIDKIILKIGNNSMIMTEQGFEIKAGEQTIEITKNGIVFNEGKNKGLIILDKLVSNLEKLSGRVNCIIKAIKTGTPATGAPDSGAAYKSSMILKLASIENEDKIEKFDELENDKIKH
jgi:hypothetical protein